MKKRLLFGCLLPLLVIGGLTWYGVRTMMRAEATPARVVPVSTGEVDIKVTETGTIEPLKKVEVKSKVAGRVSNLLVQEGDRVRSGQQLAVIDPTEIDSQVAQIQAQLDGARARYDQAIKSETYQKSQTSSGIAQGEEAVRVAEARLRMSEEENRAQPALTAGDLAQAEASLKSAREGLDLLKEASHPNAVVVAQSGYEEAKAGADNARRNLDRQQRLLDKGFVSEQLVDTARTELASANARRDQAKKRLDLIADQNRLEIASAESRVQEAQAALDRARAGRSILSIKNQEVRSARAALAQSRAQLNLAKRGDEQDRMRKDDIRAAQANVVQIENQLREFQVRQGDTTLLASMHGVVTRRYIEEGELVTSGVSSFSSGTPVMQIADLSTMLVKMSVNEVDVHKIRAGLPVEITIDGAKGVIFMGRVRKVAPAARAPGVPGQEGGQGGGGGGNGGVIQFPVEVIVDRADNRLKPGMSARCTIVVARRKGVMRLPSDCVEGEGAAAKVQIATKSTKDGKTVDVFTPRTVVAGLRGDSHIEIVSGLKAGEKVKPGIFKGPPRKAIELDMN
jgi:HlyD family secretion protein